MSFSDAAFAEPVAVCLHAAVARRVATWQEGAWCWAPGRSAQSLALIARSAGAGFVAVGDVIDEPLRRIADLGVDETINVVREADRLRAPRGGLRERSTSCSRLPAARRPPSQRSMSSSRAAQLYAWVRERGPEINVSMIVTKEINLIGSFRFDEEFRQAVDYVARNQRADPRAPDRRPCPPPNRPRPSILRRTRSRSDQGPPPILMAGHELRGTQ